MTAYDDQQYQPPAPVASLTLRTLDDRSLTVSNVLAVSDTGADVTLLPRWAVEQLGLTPRPTRASPSPGSTAAATRPKPSSWKWPSRSAAFSGRYALIDQPHGVVGRNLLNYFRLLFDGPALTWRRA